MSKVFNVELQENDSLWVVENEDKNSTIIIYYWSSGQANLFPIQPNYIDKSSSPFTEK